MSSFELSNDDVVLMIADENFTKSRTSKVEDMMEEIKDFLSSSKLPCQEWVDDGVECEVLQGQGGGWQRGKVKLSVCLEFIPDKPEVYQHSPSIAPSQPESPLDDLRSQLNPE
jgi:hypothetical protein